MPRPRKKRAEIVRLFAEKLREVRVSPGPSQKATSSGSCP